MNIKFSDENIRVRLTGEDAQRLLERGSMDASTRFPNGKRFRYGIRLAQIPATETALPVVISFTTESGGFGADLVIVILRHDLERLLAKAGSKSESIASQFATPDAGVLSVKLEIDTGNRRVASN
ncbi:MAG TPA: hypothetical protein DCS07_10015 [Bdellovibrionales bacterium]|nr:hypothetical protein [Bdellovibrionales bacterium]